MRKIMGKVFAVLLAILAEQAAAWMRKKYSGKRKVVR